MKKITSLIGIVALLLCACSKDELNAVISGRILKDCNGTPLANYELRLSVQYAIEPSLYGTGIRASIEFSRFLTQ